MMRRKRCYARDACTQRRAASEGRLEAAARRSADGVSSSTFEWPRCDVLHLRSLSFDASHQHFGVAYSAPHTYMYTLALRSLVEPLTLLRSSTYDESSATRYRTHDTNIHILLMSGPDHSPRLDRVGALMRRRTVEPRCIGRAAYCRALHLCYSPSDTHSSQCVAEYSSAHDESTPSPRTRLASRSPSRPLPARSRTPRRLTSAIAMSTA
jgi:hypothetical protein